MPAPVPQQREFQRPGWWEDFLYGLSAGNPVPAAEMMGNAVGGLTRRAFPPPRTPTGEPMQGSVGAVLGGLAEGWGQQSLGELAVDMADMVPGAGVGTLGAMMAYHGSPHKFRKFRLDKIGEGQGAQTYGHGLYFAENPDVAKVYQRELAPPTEIQDLRMGGVPIYRRGSPVDYGPRDASPAEHGQALLQEDVLINEWKIKEAFDADGEEGVERVLREAVDDRIAYAKAEWPEGLPYFEGVKRKMDRGIGRRVSLEKGADSSHLYEVDIPDEQVAKMLDWDAPFSKQPKVVREAILDIVAADGHGRSAGGVKAFIAEHGRFASTGHIDAFYEALSEKLRNQNLRAAKDAGPNPSPGWGDFGYDVRGDKDASAVLREAGIPGIKYLDQGSRGAGEGTRNFVVFDEDIPRILKRDGEDF